MGSAGGVEVANALPLTVWGGLSLIALVSSKWLESRTLSRLGCGMTAGMLFVAAAAHIIVTGARVVDPMAWAENGCFIAIALLLAMRVVRPRSPLLQPAA